MKKTMKKILALVLTMLMLLSVAAPVFANTAVTPHGDAEFVHTKANLDAQGIKYTKVSDHTSAYCEDPTYTVYQCECGVYFADDITPATGECEWEVIKEATCAEEGIRKCSVCKYEQKIAKTTDHKYVAEIPCGEPGQTTNEVCEICGDVKEDVAVAANHKWSITVTKEPECNVLGEATYTCTECGYVKTMSIKANSNHIGHNWVYGTAQEGKCFNDETGSTQPTITAGYYCQDCGVAAAKNQIIVVDGKEVENTTVYSVTPTDHNFEVQTTISYDATCTTAGFEFSGCTACGFMKTPVMTPARGHEWEREGADPLDLTKFTPDATLSTKCDAAAGTHGKDVYLIPCAECSTNGDPSTYIKITVDHSKTLEMNKVVAPTCTDEGYTCNYCAACDQAFNKSNIVPANPDNHVYFASFDEANAAGHGISFVEITAPTCTKPGVAKSICKYCFTASTDKQVIPATIHSYYELDANGNIAYDDAGKPKLIKNPGFYEYDCLNGFEIYTCNDPACKDDAEGHVLKVAIPNWDFNNLELHICWDAVNNAWNTLPVITQVGNCTTDEKVRYECNGHAINVNNGKVHQIDKTNPDSYIEETDPSCGTKGHGGYENCLNPDCDYEVGDKTDVKKELGHLYDEKTFAEKIDATCTTDGYTGYGICVRENCDHSAEWKFGEEKEENRVIPKLGHDYQVTIDTNPNANNGGTVVTCTKYNYIHYTCDRCHAVEGEKWENYIAATGHKLDYKTTDDEPTCAEKGLLTCQNADCGLFEDDGITPKTYTEEVNKLSHVDKDGNPIECVAEDFYCHECSTHDFDENGKFIGYKGSKIDAKESHQAYETVTIVKIKCAQYGYELHVCDKCKAEWQVGDMGTITHDPNNVVENWVDGKAPVDYLTPAPKEYRCGDCGALLEIKECGKGVELSFAFDNALVPGASIVNSGYLAVRVSTNSYKQMLSSVNFQFYADEDIFTLVEVKVEDTASPFYGMFFAGQTNDVVSVYGTVQNDANGNYADVEWDGADKYLVTLIFKVKDTANGEITGFVSADSAVVVNTVDGDEVNSAVAGYDYGYITVLGPVDDNDTPDDDTDDKHFELTINTLGDVNGDADRTNGLVASAIDVNKVRELIATGEYLAEADIDKDGAITVFDFEYLAEYLVGNYDYAQLCFFPDIIPEAPVVTPGCPCCP